MNRNPRKHRFIPKAPQRNRKPSAPKPEKGDGDAEGADVRNLIARFNNIQGLQRPKVEKKSSAQVAFGPGAESSSKLKRTFGSHRARDAKETCPVTNISAAYNNQLNSTSSLHYESDGFSSDSSYESAQNTKKEYREPWDLNTDYPPITLPLRKPNSGDPELLHEAEFGEDATKAEYDENTINAAKALDLLEVCGEPVLLFFKLPPQLPLDKSSANTKGKENADSSEVVKKCSDLEQMPAGYMGKMLVYQSGKIKLKLGETLYDVTPGLHTEFAQNVAAINAEEKQFCNIGNLVKRLVVTPDIDSLLNSVNDSGLPEKKQRMVSL
ncbi:hypothetical protein SLA2020_143980 [Shorea laevis]